MEKHKHKKIDFSRENLAKIADRCYNDGEFLSALRFAHREHQTYGGDGFVFARLCDIYEAMELRGSAIKWWFQFLDTADEEDKPEIYEGLAVNFLHLGNDSVSAYYYNRLIDVDDTLPEEVKMDIVDAFATTKKSKLRFVYPPQLADFTKEVDVGAKLLKAGDCERAIEEFDKVEKGSKQYAQAKEMQAVALLLSGKADEAERACIELLEQSPLDIRVQATLAATYLEQDRADESKAIALRLADQKTEDTDELYKIATVCCENDLHAEAYERFRLLDKKAPYDGRTMYFKAVSAYKSGNIEEAERTLSQLCTVYPDAEVAKYYLKAIRDYQDGEGEKPELIYFYHLPQEEREKRCRSLIQVGKSPKDEAQIFGLLLLHDGYFRWCFDEMDGGDHDLQYLGLVTAVHVRADEFIKEVLLDYEVIDVLKIETLRMLLERNEEAELGIVLCNIYKKVFLPRISIGKKRRRKFIEAYAKLASKFIVVRDSYGEKIVKAAETLYGALAQYDSLDLVDNTDDCACAILLLTGIKELGSNPEMIAAAFDANPDRVKVLLSAAVSQKYEDKEDEID